MKTSALFCLLFFSINAIAQQACPIIPTPKAYQPKNGNFVFSEKTSIVFSENTIAPQAHFLQAEVLKRFKIATTLGLSKTNSKINLVLNKNANRQIDAYSLNISPNAVTIEAANASGIFYGIISLLQMVHQQKNVGNELLLPACKISDEANYGWRGFMLDESRHFFGVEKVKQLLDWMAFYKLNRFHWHLTDEPAWRIEIKKYPLLTYVGGIGNYIEEHTPAQYYNQEQIKEIVSYAAQRFITVIPEIDMPGHATAANRAYPQYSGGGNEKHPEFTFNPGNEKTYQYLTNILKETNVLFPSGLIHIGGDEVSYGNQQWNHMTDIKQLMQKQKLKDLKDVERYFIKRISDSLTNMNAKTLAWDEVVDFNLRKDSTIVFWWRHDKPEQFERSIKNGYQVVVCPRIPFYFDFIQDSKHSYGRKWGDGSFNTLKNIYSFKLPNSAKEAKANQILGVQANLWTETIENTNRLDYMIFPRITALAEVAWNNNDQRNDFEQFMKNIEIQLPLFEDTGLYFYNPLSPTRYPEPVKTKERKLRFKTEN